MFFAYEGVIDHHVAQPLAKCLGLGTIVEREPWGVDGGSRLGMYDGGG